MNNFSFIERCSLGLPLETSLFACGKQLVT
jgi:hypothetical protein